MSKSLNVIILAAGGGTRMKSSVPKVLHPICGRPMIAYAIDLAIASGVMQPIIVVGGETADEIKPQLPKDAKVVIQKTPLGTGDAVLSTKRAIGTVSGDILILYADTPLIRRTTIQRLIENHRKSTATCTLLTTHLADPFGYGRIVRDPTGTITRIIEEADANSQQRSIREVNIGPLCVKAQSLFDALAQIKPSAVKKEWYLTEAVGIISQQLGAKIQTTKIEEASEAMGVNSRTDLVKAIGIIRQRIIDSHLQNGVTIVDPNNTYIDQGVEIGVDTVLQPGCVIETGVSIGKRCLVGPFARLRKGVTVGDDSRVGNFTELVRTQVGDRVRISHVSYLGDAIVDNEVNIGAGTITANYDGTSKHQTTIGKGAFIGSDTVLIAPVKIGSGAITGAGSVIPKEHDVPARGVVVGVPARILEKPKEEKEAKKAAKGKGAKPKISKKPKKVKTVKKAKVKKAKQARKQPKKAAVKKRLPKTKAVRVKSKTKKSRSNKKKR